MGAGSKFTAVKRRVLRLGPSRKRLPYRPLDAQRCRLFSKTVQRTIVPLDKSNPRPVAIPIASCSIGTTFYASSPRSNLRKRYPPISFGGSNPTRNSTGSIKPLKAFGQILNSYLILRVIDEPALRMATRGCSMETKMCIASRGGVGRESA